MIALRSLWLAALLAAAPLFGQITVTSSGATSNRNVINAAGTAYNGAIVLVGWFDDGFDVAANATNLSALNGAFNRLGSVAPYTDRTANDTTRNIFGLNGRFSVSTLSTSADSDGKKAYWMIFRTTGNAALDFSGSTNIVEYGIFSSSLSNWSFVNFANIPPANTQTISSAQVDQAFFGSIVGGATGSLQLAVVPEPAAIAAFFGLCALFYAARRQRLNRTKV